MWYSKRNLSSTFMDSVEMVHCSRRTAAYLFGSAKTFLEVFSIDSNPQFLSF